MRELIELELKKPIELEQPDTTWSAQRCFSKNKLKTNNRSTLRALTHREARATGRTCPLQTRQLNAAAASASSPAGWPCLRPPGAAGEQRCHSQGCPGAGQGLRRPGSAGKKRGPAAGELRLTAGTAAGAGGTGAAASEARPSPVLSRELRGSAAPARLGRPHGPGAAAALGAQPGGGIRPRAARQPHTRPSLPGPAAPGAPRAPPAPAPLPRAAPAPAGPGYSMSHPHHGAPARPAAALTPPARSAPSRAGPSLPHGAGPPLLPARRPPRSHLGYRHRPARRCPPPSQLPSGDCRCEPGRGAAAAEGYAFTWGDGRTAAGEAQGGEGRGGAWGAVPFVLLVLVPFLSPNWCGHMARPWEPPGRSARRYMEWLCASLHPRACLGQWPPMAPGRESSAPHRTLMSKGLARAAGAALLVCWPAHTQR